MCASSSTPSTSLSSRHRALLSGVKWLHADSITHTVQPRPLHNTKLPHSPNASAQHRRRCKPAVMPPLQHSGWSHCMQTSESLRTHNRCRLKRTWAKPSRLQLTANGRPLLQQGAVAGWWVQGPRHEMRHISVCVCNRAGRQGLTVAPGGTAARGRQCTRHPP